MAETFCDVKSRAASDAKFENLTEVIKDIARCQAEELQKKDRKRSNFKLWDLTLDIAKLSSLLPGFLKDLSENTVKQELNTLQQAAEALVSNGHLVKNQRIGQLVPIPYEVLRLIFNRTTEVFRLEHFHKLLNFYYRELESRLKEKLETIYPERLLFDFEVKTLLPIVKIEILQEMLKQISPNSFTQINELGNNLKNFFHNPRLNQEDIFEVIENKLGSSQFSLQTYQLIPLKESNGYLGEYFQLKVGIRHALKDETLHLFAKFLTPKAEFLKELLKFGPSMKEDWFYFGFLTKLRDIGLSELLDYAPDCYFSRIDDVIILDDMSKLGFVCLTPNRKLEYTALRLGVRELAKFHACSLILEEELSKKEGKEVRLCDVYGKYLKEASFTRDSSFVKDLGVMAKNYLMYFLSIFPGLKGNRSDEDLNEKINKCLDMIFEKVKKSEKYRNVICHGDAYVSNMLFKFDDQGECQEVKLIDFQLLRYCPPTQDLVYFLIQNSLKETLDRHFTDLIDEYYTCLSNHLQKHDIDINAIYPRNVFNECVDYMKSQGVMQAIFYSPFQSLDPELRGKVTESNEEIDKMKSDPLYLIKKGLKDKYYAEVMRGLTEHFVELDI